MTLADTFTKIFATVQKDEHWLVTEIARAQALLTAFEKKAELDIESAYNWIATHQKTIEDTMLKVLGEISLVAPLFPEGPAAVAAARIAIDAATGAIDVLAKGVEKGATPIGTIVNAYHSVKAAQTAVNSVLVHATTAPAGAPK